MRIVSQNIWHGGGDRVEGLVERLCALEPDVLVLLEFRGTPPSRTMAEALRGRGFDSQVSTARKELPRENAILVASRHPLATIDGEPVVEERKRIFVHVDSPSPFALLALHVPNRERGTKWQMFDEILRLLRAHAGEPALLVGDLNSGRQGADEQGRFFNDQEDAWMRAIEEAGWRDLYRARHGDAPAWSWHEPRGGNGFRIDHAFATAPVAGAMRDVRYEWLVGRDGQRLSDHAAMVVEFEDEGGCAGARWS